MHITQASHRRRRGGSTWVSRPTSILFVGALTVATVGCASLDPTEDIGRADSLVESRSLVETGWDASWTEAGDVWDGRSPLSAQQAALMALRNNPAIRRDVETIVASRADYVQAHLLPNPLVNIALGFPTDSLGGTPLGVGLVQQLAWLWKRPHAIDAAQADLRQTVLTVSDAALTLVADVRSAHARVVFAERAHDIEHENLTLINRNLEIVQARYDVGEASRLDVNRVALDVEQTNTRLIQRAAGRDIARRALLAMIGRADHSAHWTTDDIAHAALTPGSDQPLDEGAVIAMALGQRLDVAAAQAQHESAQHRVELARLGRWGDVGVGVEYRQNFTDRPGVFPTVRVMPPLFDDARARIAWAESQRLQLEMEAARVAQFAIGQARQAYIKALASDDIVAAYEHQVIDLARTNTQLAQAAFDVGEADLTVLLEAQRRLNDARLALNNQMQTATLKWIELERAVGGSFTIQPPNEEMFGVSAVSSADAANDHGEVIR